MNIYYLAETGSEDAILTKLLDRYASESSHIRWERKDPAVYPTFAAQYGVQSAENGSLILVSGEKSVVLEASDLYDYDYSDYYATGSYSVTFGGENKLTAAIYRVTSGETLHTYYTTNHGEQALTDTLIDALEGQNLAVSPLDLLTDAIPDDCDLLIVNTPQQDFAAAGSLVDEMSALRAYLKSGGRLMLTTDSYYSTPNLDALMAEFGLSRTPGLVVEGDSGHSLSGYPYYLLPDYAEDTGSGTLDGIDTSRRVLLQMAQGITLTETEGVTSEPLLVSSESSYSKTAGYEMTTAGQEEATPTAPSRWRLTPPTTPPALRSSGPTAAIWTTRPSTRPSRQRDLLTGLCGRSGRAGGDDPRGVQGAGGRAHHHPEPHRRRAGAGVRPHPSGGCAGRGCSGRIAAPPQIRGAGR